VFEGEHQAVGRSVAVKLLFPELTQSNETVLRFQREARAAAAIARRGVVDILDFDVDPVVGPYLVMEQLRGESLLSRIKTAGRLDPHRAFTIAGEICETLAAVHERGIIHRDLKPANVFLAVEEEGEEVVKLLDFGISRVAPAPGRAPLTVPGTVLGTPRYMAPEQAACDPGVDHRADLYATGLILYHALSGVKPFADVKRGDLLVAVIRDGPKPLRHIYPGLPDTVYALVAQAMERDRERRFQSALALGRSIEQVLAMLPLPAERPPLTADDDDAPTAIESSHESTLRAVQPLAAPPTALSPSAPVHVDEDSSRDGCETISEIPSRRLVAAPEPTPDQAAVPAEPPETVETVRPSYAVDDEQERVSSGHWQASPDTPSTPDSLANMNQRESKPWIPYGSGASAASVELIHDDTPPSAVTPPPKVKPKAPPTLDVTGGLPVIDPRFVKHAAAPAPSPSTRSAATPAPPRRRRPWVVAIIVLLIALVVGAGGLFVGLHLFERIQTYHDTR